MTGGKPVATKVEEASSVKDSLGFNRPHPMFLPDAMYNAARVVQGHMLSGHGSSSLKHQNLVKRDARWDKLPEEVKKQILFIYGVDRYHGDTNANNPDMHEAYVSLYIDIYQTYGSLDFLKSPSKDARYVIAGENWDGILKKSRTINGRTYNKTLIQEMDEKYNRNYLETYQKTTGNFRIGVFYGMEALSMGTYYWEKWNKEVKDALIAEGKLDANGNPIGGNAGNGGTESFASIIYAEASKHLGKEYYVFGADGHTMECKGNELFDCSSFARHVIMKTTGIWLDRDSRSQRKQTKRIQYEDLKPGDLIFRHDGSTSDDGSVGHVMVYVGDGKVIHASSSKTGIIESKASSYKGGKYTYGRIPGIESVWAKYSTDSNANGLPAGGGIPGVVFPVGKLSSSNLVISSQYGWRYLNGRDNKHLAIDISSCNQSNVKILSALDGKVVQIGRNKSPFTGYGNVVRVSTVYNGHTYNIQYNHLASISVSVGQTVKAGQQIGIMGATGGNYAVHLDMEVELDSKPVSDGTNRNRIHPLTIYGFNNSWDRDTRNKWLDSQNIKVQCNTTCTNNKLLEKNTKDGFKTFNCTEHRDKSSKYPK